MPQIRQAIVQFVVIVAVMLTLFGCGGTESPPPQQDTPEPGSYPVDVVASPMPMDAYPAEDYPVSETPQAPINQTEAYPEPETATDTP